MLKPKDSTPNYEILFSFVLALTSTNPEINLNKVNKLQKHVANIDASTLSPNPDIVKYEEIHPPVKLSRP